MLTSPVRMPLWCWFVVEENPRQALNSGCLFAILLDQASLQRSGQALTWLPSTLWHIYVDIISLLR